MKKFSIILTFFLFSSFPQVAFGFGNPADTLALVKLLANSIEQLIRMKQIVDNGKKNIEMIQDLNGGISAALGMLKSAYPEIGDVLYQDWSSVDQAMKEMERLYGKAQKSEEREIFTHLDRGIVEAILLHNKNKSHASSIDEIGERIKNQSMGASPKGAARLTAQSLGVLLHVENQNLRAQSASLKLQAQQMAYEAKKEKDSLNFFIESSNVLKSALKEDKEHFTTPRFR